MIEAWPYILAVLTITADALASAHAILTKRDSRAALLWVGFIWFVPLFGAVLYLLFGINRIRRRARWLREMSDAPAPAIPDQAAAHIEAAAGLLADKPEPLRTLSRLVSQVAARPLVPGNRITPLVNGDQTYPAMLAAIDEAQHSITLATYIFDNDGAGRQFVAALGRAVARGVEVRVLVDDAGARYSWPTVVGALRRAGVPVARFLPTLAPWRLMVMNLRNHRKIMVVDGRVGFTGGINIRIGNLLNAHPSHPVQDLHFRIEGPVVTQLQETFADDWAFTTREVLTGPLWFPPVMPDGPTPARGVPDGPDEDFERLRWTILGALACARSSVQVMTPYFLPDPVLVTALNVAALRGARVDIVLPARSNLRFVDWASMGMWWQVLERGCRIWLTPAPFDHSKLMVIDGQWVLLGSANWDARSLRLNFEFNVECYGAEIGNIMETFVEERRTRAREVTYEEMRRLSLPVRLRNGIARLMSPYL